MVAISGITVSSSYVTVIVSNYCWQFMMIQHYLVSGIIGEIFSRPMDLSISLGKDKNKHLNLIPVS